MNNYTNEVAFLEIECIESIKYFRAEIRKEDGRRKPNQGIIKVLMLQISMHQQTLDSIRKDAAKLN